MLKKGSVSDCRDELVIKNSHSKRMPRRDDPLPGPKRPFK
jgi:hypothetical protein